MEELLKLLRRDYAHLHFIEGPSFCWSPDSNQIFYNPHRKNLKAAHYSVLHEVAHAVLEHKGYATDYELLRLEVAAWEKAELIATDYGISIDEGYVQDCLDSYRDWLYKRSICPICGNKTIQCDNAVYYLCFNCRSRWHVAGSKFCRPYRHAKDQKKSSANVVADDFLEKPKD